MSSMEGQNGGSASEAQSLTDIQSYLANFNKEIADGTGQTIILQPPAEQQQGKPSTSTLSRDATSL